MEAGEALERRVVSILFADLVGFTSLSDSLDAEDVATIQSVVEETRMDVATNCSEMQVAETSPYSHSYSLLSPVQTTHDQP